MQIVEMEEDTLGQGEQNHVEQEGDTNTRNEASHGNENEVNDSEKGKTNKEENEERTYVFDGEGDARLKGAELYKQGDIDGAIECWSKGLRTLQFILNKKEEFSHDATSTEEFQNKWNFYVSSYIKLASNLALAHMKKEEYMDCIKFCEDVLRYDCENLKAFLRITQANMELGNFSKAIEYADSALDVYPNNVEVQQLKKKVIERGRTYENLQKNFMKNMFGGINNDPRSSDGIAPSLVQMISEAVRKVKSMLTPIYSFIYKYIKGFLNLFICAKVKKT